MLREVGALATEENSFFCGVVKTRSVAAEELRGGVTETAVSGRLSRRESPDSRSKTPSASVTILFAMVSKTLVILVIALLARRESRPAKAMRAYVLLCPRARGS